MKQQAQKWREENGYTGEGVVVVIYDGEIQGWVNELRNPESWRPGCVAIDENGNRWIATCGNDYDGAQIWQPSA